MTFLTTSTPLARDFEHPDFISFFGRLNHPLSLHRKLWEWAFIYERLKRAGVLEPGRRGLVFGVGREKLPALFASLGVSVVATDAPTDPLGLWGNDQHATGPEDLFYEDIVDRETFDRLVQFEPCDMNDILPHLRGFDFCWSSCAFEHLGSIEAGFDFVVNSIEKTLKIGGVACHTTEFNFSSDENTINEPSLVLYRRRDLEQLCTLLSARGQLVEPLNIQWGDLPADHFIDEAPYRQETHLKLRVGGYIATSLGIVVRRGR
jgi:hypothetical protein